MIRALRANPRACRKHALGRFAKGDRNYPLALRKPLSGAQKERHPGPAPIVDKALQCDEGLNIGFWIHPGLGTVAAILPTHHIRRIDRQHAAKYLVLFFTDRRRLQRGFWRLHRHERRQNLKVRWVTTMSRNAPALFVETRPLPQADCLGYINLHVIGMKFLVPE